MTNSVTEDKKFRKMAMINVLIKFGTLPFFTNKMWITRAGSQKSKQGRT